MPELDNGLEPLPEEFRVPDEIVERISIAGIRNDASQEVIIYDSKEHMAPYEGQGIDQIGARIMDTLINDPRRWEDSQEDMGHDDTDEQRSEWLFHDLEFNLEQGGRLIVKKGTERYVFVRPADPESGEPAYKVGDRRFEGTRFIAHLNPMEKGFIRIITLDLPVREDPEHPAEIWIADHDTIGGFYKILRNEPAFDTVLQELQIEIGVGLKNQLLNQDARVD